MQYKIYNKMPSTKLDLIKARKDGDKKEYNILKRKAVLVDVQNLVDVDIGGPIEVYRD